MRAFSETERQRIETRLRTGGRGLFQRYGLRRTSILALAGTAGIASGSFYAFYPSKESLYCSLLLEDWGAFAARIMEVAESWGNPRHLLAGLMTELIAQMKRNELMAAYLVGEDEEILERKLSTRELAQLRGASFYCYADLIRDWQARGSIRPGDPEALSALMVSFALISAHRRDIEDRVYAEIERLIPETIAEGLAPVALVM